MTTGWLIVNIVLVAVVAAIVAVPAVLIPNLLDRDARQAARQRVRARRWSAEDNRSDAAA